MSLRSDEDSVGLPSMASASTAAPVYGGYMLKDGVPGPWDPPSLAAPNRAAPVPPQQCRTAVQEQFNKLFTGDLGSKAAGDWMSEATIVHDSPSWRAENPKSNPLLFDMCESYVTLRDSKLRISRKLCIEIVNKLAKFGAASLTSSEIMRSINISPAFSSNPAFEAVVFSGRFIRPAAFVIADMYSWRSANPAKWDSITALAGVA